jgi:DNA-binding CsgD family transcriptional regulator
VARAEKAMTPRERDVFRLAAQDLSSEDIGGRLGIDASTARVLKGRVKRKLLLEIDVA